MHFKAIDKILGDTWGTDSSYGRILYDAVLNQRPQRCLELGFASGRGTCYIAAALDELGRGRLDTVDRPSAKTRSPTVHENLRNANLAHLVDVHYERTSYIWFLKKKIESLTVSDDPQKYDFVFLDGAHDWYVDGFAFFLVDKLLRKGGTILFDDYAWTYEKSPTHSTLERVKDMPDDERTEPHIGKVFDLLVKQHPSYSDFRIINNHWAFARKTRAEDAAPVRTERRITMGLPVAVRAGRFMKRRAKHTAV